MISSSVRNLVALIWWLALAIAALYVNLQVTVANYLGSKSALELQGYEQQPLFTDPLVGRFLGSYLGEATLAQFFALGVAIVQALSLFLLFHTCFELWKLFEIRSENSRLVGREENAGVDNKHDPKAEVRAANRLMARAIVEIILLIGILIPVINWDIDLWRFRSMADALANGSPDVNPMQIPSWVNFVSANDHLFVKTLIGFGAWGYVGVTSLGCLLLEVFLEKLDQRWARLMAPVDQAVDGWFAPVEEEVAFYGYDHDGQPVYDEQTPIAFDTAGNPVDNEEVTVVNVRATRVATEDHDHARQAEADVQTVDPVVAQPVAPQSGNGNGHSTPLFDLSQSSQRSPNEEWPQVIYDSSSSVNSNLRDVIGAEGEQVSLEEALSNGQRYHVTPATGQIWDRKHWESLHGVSSEPEAKQ